MVHWRVEHKDWNTGWLGSTPNVCQGGFWSECFLGFNQLSEASNDGGVFSPSFFWWCFFKGDMTYGKAWMVPGTLKLTASLHPKIDGWKAESFIFVGWPICRDKLAVSFRECTLHLFFFWNCETKPTKWRAQLEEFQVFSRFLQVWGSHGFNFLDFCLQSEWSLKDQLEFIAN